MRATFRHPGWHWIGILLVLFNLLAPGVSHAVRQAQAGGGTGVATLADLCSAAHDGTAAPADADAALSATLDACAFCAHGLLSGAAPLPEPSHLLALPRTAAGHTQRAATLAHTARTPIAAAPQAP